MLTDVRIVVTSKLRVGACIDVEEHEGNFWGVKTFLHLYLHGGYQGVYIRNVNREDLYDSYQGQHPGSGSRGYIVCREFITVVTLTKSEDFSILITISLQF